MDVKTAKTAKTVFRYTAGCELKALLVPGMPYCILLGNIHDVEVNGLPLSGVRSNQIILGDVVSRSRLGLSPEVENEAAHVF